jgi:hypothetical protein
MLELLKAFVPEQEEHDTLVCLPVLVLSINPWILRVGKMAPAPLKGSLPDV